MRRKPVLVVGIAGFVVANGVTALAGDYPTAMVARFVAGAFSGLLWSMMAGYARRVVAPDLAGRALAVAMVGTPLALSIGTPLGTLTGSVVGWRWIFAAMSALAVAALLWVVAAVPDRPGQPPENSTPLLRVALLPGIRPVLAVVLTWMLAHNILYTYIAPYLSSTGVQARVDVVLLVFGVAALGGIWLTGVLVDRALRPLVIGSLTAFGLVALALALAGSIPVVLYGAVALWGLSFGGAATQLQTSSADAAGDDADVAQAMITTTWNLAIFGGATAGGLILGATGPAFFPWILAGLVAVALVITTTARRAFPPGRREAP